MSIICRIAWPASLAVLGALASSAQETRAPQAEASDWLGQTDTATQQALAGAKLVDSVVAVVGRRVITLSELRAEARVGLADHGALEAAQGELSPALLSASLEYVISQLLVEEEASRLQVFPVTAAECQVAEDLLATHFPTRLAFESFLDRFGIDREQLRATLTRRLRASRYLENRLRLQSQPNDAEVDALLARRPSDPSVPKDRAAATAWLQQQKYNELAKSLVAELRERAEVRILASAAQ